MDLKTLTSAIMEITEEKGISQEKVLEIIESALASAYKKEFGKKKEKFEAKLDPKTGELNFWQVKIPVSEDMILSEEEIEKMKEEKGSEVELRMEDEEILNGQEKIRFNPDRHILIEEAKKINPEINVGEELKIPVETKEDFGRIAAQTAKQVILQKIKEMEKEVILNEFKDKEGEIVSGIVQRIEPRAIFFDIGKTSGVLPKSEQVPREFYRPGQRLKLFVLKVEVSPKGPIIFLSRAYPKLVSKLFELEVPEISANQVEIKAIAREAGSRTKVAVSANEDGIDPIGSLVGQRGTRILAVINELGGEKIDVVEWSDDPAKLISNSLSPAKILEVKTMPKNMAEAIVDSDQLSLAIGKDGQNVRLAAKLTGWKIDIKSIEGESKKFEESEEIEEAEESAESAEEEEVKEPESEEKTEAVEKNEGAEEVEKIEKATEEGKEKPKKPRKKSVKKKEE